MEDTNIKRGDVVRMKSGSCNMSVFKVETHTNPIKMGNAKPLNDKIISVEYFWEGEIKTAKFYESQIIVVPD